MKGNSFLEKMTLLENVYKVTDFSRLNTIAEIGKINQKFDSKLETVLNIKNIFTFLEKKYQVQSTFYIGYKKKLPKLWIYISEFQEIGSNYYENIENILLNNFNKENDFFLAIGEKAINYANVIEAKSLISFETNNNIEETSIKIYNVIFDLFMSAKVGEVIFLLNSNKIKNSQLTVLPIENMNLNINELNHIHFIQDFNNKNIYPNIFVAFDNLFKFYISSIIPSLLHESKFFKLQQQLIKEMKMLEEITAKIQQLKREFLKFKREQLTEEMILISQTNKDHEEIENDS